jgi:hypothetical protein
MPPPATIQAATLEKFLAAWRNQDEKETVALWSDDFQQRLLPLSLKVPVKSRAEATAVNSKLIEHLTNWKVSSASLLSAICVIVLLTVPIAGDSRDCPRR